MSANQLLFSTRIVSVDSYMCDPVPGLDICRSEFRKNDVKSVPVIRVFGSTPAGQTTCLHIHGVFPYLMVPYCGPDVMESHWSEIEQYMQQMAASLDSALNSASGKSKSDRQHVFKIVILRGIPFYGYHQDEELFLKIYFYLPGDIKRAAELLQSGMVLDRQFQPHEAHVPYILQLFLDYNLYGMNLLHAKNCWFRLPIGKPDPITELPRIKRPDDIQGSDSGGQTSDGKPDIGTTSGEIPGGKLHIPTTSQLKNFNWNLLREKAASTYSQKHQQGLLQELDVGDDSDFSHTSSGNIRKTSKDEDGSQANISQLFSCSDLCKSILSKTLQVDSQAFSTGGSTPPLCPLHAKWSGQNIPPASKLSTDIGRHSTCDLEVDVIAADISNRDELSGSSSTNPGIAAIWEDERARRREREEDSQIPVAQSQPRFLPSDLSEKEAQFIQMLYDALDRHQEENSLASSFDDSLSVTTSQLTRRSSSESGPRRRECKDMFASSGESAARSSMSVVEKSTPDPSTAKGSQDVILPPKVSQGESSLGEDDLSTLDLMRKLEEEDEHKLSVATQRGNGPFDNDNEQLTPEDVTRSQTILRRRLSVSLSNSQLISSLPSSPDTTQPISPPGEDDDAIEEFEMSQRWDSAIQDLLKDLSDSEVDDDDDNGEDIPQIDGAADHPSKSACATTKRLGSTRRGSSSSARTKSSVSVSISDKNEQTTVNTRNTSERMFKVVNNQTSEVQTSAAELDSAKTSDMPCMSDTKVMAVDVGDAVTSDIGMEKCTAASHAVSKPSETSCNMQLSKNKILPTQSTSKTDNIGLPKILQKTPDHDCKSPARTAKDHIKVQDTIEKRPGTNIDTTSNFQAGKQVCARWPKTGSGKDRGMCDKSHLLAEMVENYVLVENCITQQKNLPAKESWNEEKGKDGRKSEGAEKKSTSDKKSSVKSTSSKSHKNRRKSDKDTGMKAVEARTNVFASIMGENAGVALFEDTSQAEVQRLTHSAVINLSSLPADNTAPLSSLDNTVIKVTSTPVIGNNPAGNMRTRNCRANRRNNDPQEKPTRTRRPRSASKNSYLEDSIYETVFNSDWDSDDSMSYAVADLDLPNSRGSRPKRTKRSCCDQKRKKKAKQKVITKWIIVNRFKGVSNMKIGLWKIPLAKRVKLTPELLRLYDVYSPTKENFKNPPVKPPALPPSAKPRPMGKRSKKRLAISCSFERDFLSEKCDPVKLSHHQNDGAKEDVSVVKQTVSEPEPFASLKVEPSGTLVLSNTSHGHSTEMQDPSLSITAGVLSDCFRRNSAVSLENFPEKGEVENSIPAVPCVSLSPIPEVSKIMNISSDSNECSLSMPKTSDPLVAEDSILLDSPPPRRDEKKQKDSGEFGVEKIQQRDSEKISDLVCKDEISSNAASPGKGDTLGNKLTSQQSKCSETAELDETSELVASRQKAASNTDSSETVSDPDKLLQKQEDNGNKVTSETDTQSSVELIMKTYPILTSIFLKSKQPVKKSEKKKSVKLKKDAKRRKSNPKLERNSPSPHDSDKDTKILKSIVPVSSRTVEPLCNRVSPDLNDNSVLPEDKDLVETEDLAQSTSSGILLDVQKLSQKRRSPSSKAKSEGNEKPLIMPQLEKISPRSKDVCVTSRSPEKKSSFTIVPSTKKVYSPSRKVTRNSVAVKLNSISAPKCMFTSFSDDSSDPWPPPNALAAIAFPAPNKDPEKLPSELPRPWSPKITHTNPEPQEQQTEANDILEDFAESFGADASKMLGLVDDSVFKNMDCIDQLISDSQKMSSPSNLREDSENFDKIFENVSSNAAATSKGSRMCKPSSDDHLDEFEEETLMEFIDEMTSPTVSADSNAAQLHGSSFPTPQPDPHLVKDDSDNTSPQQMIFPALQNPIGDNRPIPVLPTVAQQDTPDSSMVTQQRPLSTLRQLPTLPALDQKNSFVHAHGQQPPSLIPTQSWGLDNCPQSCLPGSAIPGNVSNNRPASALGLWPNKTVQSQPCLYNGTQMKEIRKNMSSPNMFDDYSHSKNLHARSGSAFYSGSDSLSQPVGCQLPPKYPQYQFPVDSQEYAEQSQVPRPSSVMDPPLQVFHTHVHHHHHVHSIKNPPSGSKLENQQGTAQPHLFHHHQQQHMYPVATTAKCEATARNVKTENLSTSTPWPTSTAVGMVTPEQSRTPKPIEKPKNKTQFYVPNSPFPYPKEPVTPLHLGPQGLVQTLTYVETTASESFVSEKSDFYTFAGMHRGLHKQKEHLTQSFGGRNPSAGVMSVLLKGSCQVGRNFSTDIADNTTPQKVKDKVTWHPLPTLPMERTPPAKTPYGLMKQNSLNALKKKSKASKVTERKRKTISDFRAPPDTPTISLTGDQTAANPDMLVSSGMFSQGYCDATNGESGYSLYNFAFVRDEAKKRMQENVGDNLKLTISKNNLSKPAKRTKKRQKRRNTASEIHSSVVGHGSCPVPRKGEEIVLDPVTGNWEIAPVENTQKDVPLVFAPEEQTLSRPQEAKLPEYEVHDPCNKQSRMLTTKPIAKLYPLPTIPKQDSQSSSDDLEDFAVSKKKRKKFPKVPAGVKRASSTPEYMVSAVNFESSSPKLKLTLKKTPPSRGKPKLSTLVTSSDIESVIPVFADSKKFDHSQRHVVSTADSYGDCSGGLGQSSTVKFKTEVETNAECDSDSDFKIEDASSSTDDASEIEDILSPAEAEPQNLDFQMHLDNVKNMYTPVGRSKCDSVLVELDERIIQTAIMALDVKVTQGKQVKRSSGKKPLRSKSGRFISRAKANSPKTKTQDTSLSGDYDSFVNASDAPPPKKKLRMLTNVETAHGSPTASSSMVISEHVSVIKPNPEFLQKEDIAGTDMVPIHATVLPPVTDSNSSIILKPDASIMSSTLSDECRFCPSTSGSTCFIASEMSCPEQNSSGGDVTCTRTGSSKAKNSRASQNAATGPQSHTDGERPDEVIPPSPNEEKTPPGRRFLASNANSAFLYRTVKKPPTKDEVISDVKTLKLPIATDSKEPFYSECSDAQTTSHRLSNLPPYIKRPKVRKTVTDLPEFESNLLLGGGLHHWTVLATAAENHTAIENAVMRQKAAEFLPPNVHVWDHLDTVTKLPQYPALAKVFLGSGGCHKQITLRPTVVPPSCEEVTKWLQEKQKDKSGKTLSTETTKSGKVSPGDTFEPLLESSLVSAHENSPDTPTSVHGAFRRSLSLASSLSRNIQKSSRPRRVSFDLSSFSVADDNGKEARAKDEISTVSKSRKLESIKGSPAKYATSMLTDAQTSQSDVSTHSSKSSMLFNLTSPVIPSENPQAGWDETTSFGVSPATLPSIQAAVTPDGSSSAIKTLVGSSDTDKTSPLTFLISGSFTPPPCSTQKSSSQPEGGDMLSSLKKQPQSTPNITGGRQRTHALRKLAFTPVKKENLEKSEVVPSTATLEPISPTSSQQLKLTSQQTPTSKGNSLRKRVLAKKFQSADPTGGPKPPTSNKPSPRKDSASSPVVLETPQSGQRKEGSQIDGPTLDNTYGFKAAQQHLGEAKSLHIVQHITSVSIELHVKTRIDLRPDPDMDEIRCLFFCLDSDAWTDSSSQMRTGVIIVDPDSVSNEESSAVADEPSTSTAIPSTCFGISERELLKKSGISGLDVMYVKTEVELFLLFAQMMHGWDPDVLVGYEVQMLSWGFLLQRAAHLRCDLCRAISRIPTDEQRNKYQAERDVYGADNASELHIVGRIVLNLWRLLRTELALYDYSFESVAYHLLHERHPKYSHHTLTNWFDPPSKSGQPSHIQRYRVVDYYIARVRGNMRLLQQQDLVDRTSELARLFGIQFYDVLTRGSQFRVESMLLRTARARNMVAVTPSVLQRAQMRAPEVIALVMEPESKFYHVPVLVLDFQSLYPSMVIAYNICFSTCLGRVKLLGSDAFFTFGCTSLRVPAKTLKRLLRKDLITINPSGVAYVKSSVRKGVMPQMLDEILTTRIMVKNSMKKLGPDQAATKRMLDHRQLGLKLIANVTYGYTAANFSGRMPCVEVGDSIVHKARETLERAIHLVTRNSERWENARVVYGDTDSMFIALEGADNSGCTKERAFEIGKEIAAEVTADNPTPVKLKFEKVYLPCVLQTKKRYVGYAFETEDQKEPAFDAKGIETVRRDGTPATAKILEKTLKILFDTRDVSKVKEYVLKQCSKILDGRTTLQDCIIAKEYRGKQYYKPGAVVPALNIARKLVAMDKRAEPRVGERVPYVIVHGAPGTPLYQLVRSPLEVLKDPSLQLNGAYYVTKHILPALDRVLSLLGVDVFLWHRHLPRTIHISHNAGMENSQDVTSKKATISQFFKSKHCLMCKKLSVQSICDECLTTGNGRKQATAVSLAFEAKSLEKRKYNIEQICMQCTGATCPSEVRCVSLDCPILYKLHRATDKHSKTKAIRKALLNEEML